MDLQEEVLEADSAAAPEEVVVVSVTDLVPDKVLLSNSTKKPSLPK